jgi:hypothetical protein
VYVAGAGHLRQPQQTYVNRRTVESAILANGDEVEIGHGLSDVFHPAAAI